MIVNMLDFMIINFYNSFIIKFCIDIYGRRIINTTVKKLERTYTVQRTMNVRKKANTSSKVLRTVKRGSRYKATKTYNHWAYFPALKGWICIKNGSETYLK